MIRLFSLSIILFLLIALNASAGIGMRSDLDEDESELPVCEPDGNDTSVDAVPVMPEDVVIQAVCPDDPIDYFSFAVPAGASVSGNIVFRSSRAGTVVRLTRGSSALFEQSTTDSSLEIHIPVTITDSPGETFYLRVTYYSAYADTHYFAIWTHLTLSGCFEEGNDTKETAEPLEFGETIHGSLCVNDSVDWFSFRIADDDEASAGWIKIDPCTMPSHIAIYDASDTLLVGRLMESAKEEFNFSDTAGFTTGGDYYVELEILDYTSEDLDEYTLKLGQNPTVSGTVALGKPLSIPKTPIWPSPDHDKFNTSHTWTKGPSNMYNLYTRSLETGYRSINQHITSGPDGNIYFVAYPGRLTCIDSAGTILWYKDYQAEVKGPFLDEDGIYTSDGRSIFRHNYNNTQGPSIQLPQEIGGVTELIALFDDLFYLIPKSGGPYLYCVNKSGNLVWQAQPGAVIYKVAVDRDKNVYVSSFHYMAKYDSSGRRLWCQQYRAAPRTNDFPATRTPYYGSAPILDKNQRPFMSIFTSGSGSEYRLFNQDGTTRHSRTWTELDRMAREVAADANGNFYLIDFDNWLRKLDNSLDEEWAAQLPGVADDMIIDGNDRIFAAYHIGGGIDTWVLRCMNREGAMLWQQTLDDIPYYSGERGWLALDNNRRLVFVTSHGWVATVESHELDIDLPSGPEGSLQTPGSSSSMSKRIPPGGMHTR